MNELSDRVRGVRQLPLFPLPVVLFPGTPLPLHIFEPRYREMLKDIQITNQLFGVSFFDASESESNVPPIGHLGCAAELRDVQELPDGRSNILCVGLMRYEVEEYLDEGEDYLVGRVSFFEDDEESDEILQPKAQKVRDLFGRIAKSVRILSDERGELPEFPETTPQQLSYFIAAAIEFDVQMKFELFKTRSTSERLDQLQTILTRAAEQFEDRADIHKVAKHNGHSKKKLDLDSQEN
jgi:ATP-dependent Lon protease